MSRAAVIEALARMLGRAAPASGGLLRAGKPPLAEQMA